MESVGFLSALETNGPPSVTNRFFESQAWQFESSTEVRRSSPMRVVPTSWMISPPLEIPQLSSALKCESTSPPAVRMISSKISRECFAIRISSCENLK